ncbi:MAG: M23 family metallopeptidase, partial [Planctomycetota bacterium]
KRRNGLLWTPFLNGMAEAARVAPGYTERAWVRTGSGKPPRAEQWTTPLLAFGEEVVQGVGLQPFGSLREDGSIYHAGEDVGACLDGAGYYAVAEGVVRFIWGGGDMGTLLVVEHDLGGGEQVNAIYTHGGDTTFVRAGDVVQSGQLLGTMGMSYSIENGGRFAHLQFGLYPGPFDMARNAGYQNARAGLGDWIEPIPFLEGWIERTRPVVEDLRPLGRQVGAILSRIERGEYGRAYLEAFRLREASQAGSEAYVDALYLEDVLKRTPKSALARATMSREAGYPNEAARRLRTAAENCKAIPGAEELKNALREWEADPQFAKALRGESRIQYTAARIAKLKDPAKARQLWERLLEQYADTCLAPRIRHRMR